MTIPRRAPQLAWTVSLLLVSMPLLAAGPVLHEPIPPDPREDLSLAASVDGTLPAAIETRSGIVTAPDPRRPTGNEKGAAPSGSSGTLELPKFVADRDTRQPDTLPYEDPFSPSTAPFKRLFAFDGVDPNESLVVTDERLRPVPLRGEIAGDGSEERFYADLVVEVDNRGRTRIPSVAPGARILAASLLAGGRRASFRVVRDGADNWFVEADAPMRGRLVMEVAAPRAAFGGDLGDPSWGDLPSVTALPPKIQKAAAMVAERIGASRAQRPREAIGHLVDYFRSFVDSEEPPSGEGDLYLDLALSKKGVCRHRAFAFVVTALGLGVPSRLVMNEAHAWVEVHDGRLFRRIDLGGAGRTLRDGLANSARHDAPTDPYRWPPGAGRGDELAARARAQVASPGPDAARSGGGPASSAGAAMSSRDMHAESDGRPPSILRVAVTSADVRRNAPLAFTGTVQADGEPCGHLPIEVSLRSVSGAGQEVALGVLATDGTGSFRGSLVVPRTAGTGPYDVIVRTRGNSRCGRGVGP